MAAIKPREPECGDEEFRSHVTFGPQSVNVVEDSEDRSEPKGRRKECHVKRVYLSFWNGKENLRELPGNKMDLLQALKFIFQSVSRLLWDMAAF